MLRNILPPPTGPALRTPEGSFRRGRRKWALLVVAILLGWPLQTSAGEGSGRFEATEAEGYRGVLEFAADPLVTMRPTSFDLILYDPSGHRTTAPTVTADLTMPAMPMPQNRPAVTAVGDRYTGEAIFTMAGAWRATFTIDGQTGRARLVFDIPRVLLK